MLRGALPRSSHPYASIHDALPCHAPCQAEDDENLTADEKALLRFQKQRLREMAGSKFALPDEDEAGAAGEQLTHLGRSLAELEDLQEVSGHASSPAATPLRQPPPRRHSSAQPSRTPRSAQRVATRLFARQRRARCQCCCCAAPASLLQSPPCRRDDACRAGALTMRAMMSWRMSW